jgi:hypothetical protein
LRPFRSIAKSAVTAATLRLENPARFPRLAREYRTLRAMVWMHCHDLHGEDDSPCDECRELLAYAARRIDRCVFGDGKPTCANCTVHCYNAVRRARDSAMPRYHGPRGCCGATRSRVAHLLDGRRRAPELPSKRHSPLTPRVQIRNREHHAAMRPATTRNSGQIARTIFGKSGH